MSDTSYTLKHSIKSTAGAPIISIEIRRPLVRDLRQAAKKGGNKEEQEIEMIGNLCHLAPDEVDKLDLADFAEIQKVIAGFLPEASQASAS